MPITRIKICGITRPEDAALAAELGAHAIGLNFVAGPRQINKLQAVEILRRLPPLVNPVALTACDHPLFKEAPSLHEISQEYPRLPIHTFQVYGESPAELIEGNSETFCWMVYSIDSRAAITRALVHVAISGKLPAAILLDTASEKLGGTGQTFNWNWIAEARAAGELNGLPPIILAGGLNPDNVADAIRIAKPYAVDVSSGVEVKGQPGIKDPIKLRDFIQAVNGADREESQKQ